MLKVRITEELIVAVFHESFKKERGFRCIQGLPDGSNLLSARYDSFRKELVLLFSGAGEEEVRDLEIKFEEYENNTTEGE